jgi:hypothetical protein
LYGAIVENDFVESVCDLCEIPPRDGWKPGGRIVSVTASDPVFERYSPRAATVIRWRVTFIAVTACLLVGRNEGSADCEDNCEQHVYDFEMS